MSSWVDRQVDWSRDVNRLDGALMMLVGLVLIQYGFQVRAWEGDFDWSEYVSACGFFYFGVFEFLIHGDLTEVRSQ